MSGLNAIEMSSLPRPRRSHGYRRAYPRPDPHEPEGARCPEGPARRPRRRALASRGRPPARQEHAPGAPPAAQAPGRRPRRACFGELVQMDASEHDWLEGRGEQLVLVSMVDDATSLTLARFYPAGTTEAHMDLLGRWLRRHGRPLALYTDRHSIFEP